MVSPLQRNAPEIIGLMGAALLLCQNSKYIPILKSKQWIQNSALRINNTLRINTHFSFLPAAMFSSGISLGVRKHICQIREQLTRAQADKAESARQVEDLRGQLTNAQADSTQIREQLRIAQADIAESARQVEDLRAQANKGESARQEIESLKVELLVAKQQVPMVIGGGGSPQYYSVASSSTSESRRPSEDGRQEKEAGTRIRSEGKSSLTDPNYFQFFKQEIADRLIT